MKNSSLFLIPYGSSGNSYGPQGATEVKFWSNQYCISVYRDSYETAVLDSSGSVIYFRNNILKPLKSV